MKEKLKYFLFRLYYVTIMCYIERDRYFDILCDESEEECNEIAASIVKNHKTL